jgi:hypothetical protein
MEDMMKGGKGMSPRKAMAGGDGNFGVPGYPPGNGRKMHPDAAMKTGEKGAMADSDRGVGMPIKHSKDHHPAQAAPDHGPAHESKMGNDYGDRRAY